ncbi:hypothetical protein K450DRAFT_224520 [Umbelopsis ramanniana AG]|uniref:Bacterial surface antigen (D15) domain-containing protein n=1 Tax=Umbelopsis ramanniana AG TaxID=1314678 RepID=A0AAD5EFY7_UMBRA|nr:uncharacterized protein K450DRAFT_224520 [Umbelopsis ramanniana AG]KAI8583168.1 hypothetical protein K450DRAFT_224520 [Umbelopsis ramanniana AG]
MEDDKERASASAPPPPSYEEAAFRMFGLLNATASQPGHVHSLRVLGTERTRDSFLKLATSNTFTGMTIADIINDVQHTADRLQRLDIFDSVNVILDTSRDPFAAKDAFDVIFSVKEKSRFFLKTGTEIGNGEGNMNGSVVIRNVFGGAEMLETSASFGTRNSSAFQFSLSRPVNASPDARIDVNAHSVVRNNMMFSSHEELVRGIGARFKGLSNWGFHEISYDLSWRTIDRIAENGSLSIRNQAGHSLKSSISHSFVRDRRDDMLLPTKGYYLRFTQELAGVGKIGDTKYLKHEVEASIARQHGGGEILRDENGLAKAIAPGIVLSLNVRGGLLATLNDKEANISDKFMLGGPLSIRGFRTCGVGPRDKKDSLGGDAYWATGVSLITPLPKLADKPLRGHAFVNAGSLIPWKTGTSTSDTIKALTASPSVAVGFGIIYRHSVARLELNFCIPLTVARGDMFKRGFQLGLGLNFM